MKKLIALAVFLAGCGSTPVFKRPLAGRSVPLTCHARGRLPDPHCTPGTTDSRVTQANLSSTICKNGYTGTVRPPVAYTGRLKALQIKQYGYSDTNPRHYEEDHLISLELGGAPSDPRNLWPEFGPSYNGKDRVEGQLHLEVCAGRLPLAKAQHEIATNWTKLVRQP